MKYPTEAMNGLRDLGPTAMARPLTQREYMFLQDIQSYADWCNIDMRLTQAALDERSFQ
jgi:hypothetical protein